jgi:hypothetical protein
MSRCWRSCATPASTPPETSTGWRSSTTPSWPRAPSSPGQSRSSSAGDAVVKDYGPRGKLYEVPLSDGGTGVTASWGDQMLLVGADEAGLKSILDRLDSPSPSPAALTEEQAYGEVYGVISPDTIGRIFGEENPELAETFLQATTGVELHADVSHDVGLVADLTGADPSKTEELRRALGGALSLARMRAQSKGHTDEAELLDLARVSAAGERQVPPAGRAALRIHEEGLHRVRGAQAPARSCPA